jgi:hypothetical protein
VGRAGLSYGYVVQLAMEQTSSARLPLREDTAVHALEVGPPWSMTTIKPRGTASTAGVVWSLSCDRIAVPVVRHTGHSNFSFTDRSRFRNSEPGEHFQITFFKQAIG